VDVIIETLERPLVGSEELWEGLLRVGQINNSGG